MTSSTIDPPTPPPPPPPAPAWYRRLPKPPTESVPSLRRPSLLSQHHIFRDPSPESTVRTEDGLRRHTVHFPQPSQPAAGTRKTLPAFLPPVDRETPTQALPTRIPSVTMAKGDSQPSTNDPPSAPTPREHLCLCPPDPKIPRPRNSFILFRQHQQASIIAQNPGIPNPEVSKIIGEQWRALSSEAKEEWNLLAEEEKVRHQQQYPGYRYHPRRSGRVSQQSSVSGPSSAEPQEPCAKCGGKPMNYYNNLAPVYAPVAVGHQHAVAAATQLPAKRAFAVSNTPAQRVHGPPVESPEHGSQPKPFVDAYPYQRVDPRLIYTMPPAQNLPTPPTSDSQDTKRRRFNSGGVYIPTREPYGDPTYSYVHSPGAKSAYPRVEVSHQIHPPQLSAQHVPGMQVAKPALVSPPRVVYPHPPQLQPIRPPQTHERTRSTVALPPIETLVAQPATKLAESQSQTSGVEAMIMSIPVLNKIKVLAQISPPLKPPSITSPKPEVRGAIIAVEGMDASAVHSMTRSLREQLEKESKYAVRIFTGPDLYTRLRGPSTEANGTMSAEPYLSMLSEWHKISKEMTKFISTRPGTEANGNGDGNGHNLDASNCPPQPIHGGGLDSDHPTTCAEDPSSSENGTRVQLGQPAAGKDTFASVISPNTLEQATALSLVSPPLQSHTQSTSGVSSADVGSMTEQSRQCAAVSFPRPANSTRIPPPPPTPPPATPPAPLGHALSRFSPPGHRPSSSLSGPSLPAWQTEDQKRSGKVSSSNAIPIALVPHFQLTTVDASSIAQPIGDGFSPPAHWQWFATIWRGITGPDITIVIKGADEEHELEAARTNGGPVPGTPGTGRERMSNRGSHSSGPHTGVEIRLSDSRAVVVRTAIVNTRRDSANLIAMGAVSDDKSTQLVHGTTVNAAQQAKDVENWEKAKRRVGFEVEEFLIR